MAEISTYSVAGTPKLSDKLVGTSVGGDPENKTYNFTIQQFLALIGTNLGTALPSYADNAAAITAGKAVGTVYINTTDHTVKVVY